MTDGGLDYTFECIGNVAVMVWTEWWIAERGKIYENHSRKHFFTLHYSTASCAWGLPQGLGRVGHHRRGWCWSRYSICASCGPSLLHFPFVFLSLFRPCIHINIYIYIHSHTLSLSLFLSFFHSFFPSPFSNLSVASLFFLSLFSLFFLIW